MLSWFCDAQQTFRGLEHLSWEERLAAGRHYLASKTHLSTGKTCWEMVCYSSTKHSSASIAGYVVPMLWGWFVLNCYEVIQCTSEHQCCESKPSEVSGTRPQGSGDCRLGLHLSAYSPRFWCGCFFPSPFSLCSCEI